MSNTLHEHEQHFHEPHNVNQRLAEERESSHWAHWLTMSVGRGRTAFVFTVWLIVPFVGVYTGLANILGWITPLSAVLALGALQFLFLFTFLPILSIGQASLNKRAVLQSDEQYATTLRTYHEFEQVAKHLDAQDEKIQEILARLDKQAPIEPLSPLALPQRKTTRKRAEP